MKKIYINKYHQVPHNHRQITHMICEKLSHNKMFGDTTISQTQNDI